MVSPSGELIIRSENAIGRSNPRRSRRSSTQRRFVSGVTSMTADMQLPGSIQTLPVPSRASSFPQGQSEVQGHLYTQGVHPYSPLSTTSQSVPAPLLRSRMQRAIERFFLDWIMYPCCTEKICPGYLHLTVELYHSSSSSPLLRSAVQALAFANVRGAHDLDGRSFLLKAQACYGNAIQQLRHLVETAPPHVLAGDDVVASILFLDSWELMYQKRAGIAGSHGNMLFHILTARLNTQVESDRGHPIWRAANYRLLIHLIMTGEDAKLEQLQTTFVSETSEPYTRMVADAFQIAKLRAEIRRCIPGNEPVESSSSLEADQGTFESIIDRACKFVETTRLWLCEIPPVWKPQKTDMDHLYDSDGGISILQQRLDLSDRSVLRFHGLWMAAIWASHWACLLLLHDSLAEAITYGHQLGCWQGQTSDGAWRHEEEASVKQLASNILQTVPFLLGHVPNDFCAQQSSCTSGMMLARLFFLFPLSVVEGSSCATLTQSETAGNVRRWLQEEHRVG